MELRETYNLLAKKWSQDKHGSEWCHDFLTIFASRVGPGAKVLDVGCGSGETVEFLASFGVNTIGVDFSDKLIAEAQKSYPKNKFMVMDMRQLSFGTESFDGVLAKHSLLHLSKKEMPIVLKAIHNLLKPSGWFLFTLKEGVGERKVEEERYGHQVTRFFAFYTSFEVEKLIKESGFKIIEEGISKGGKSSSLKFLAQKV